MHPHLFPFIHYIHEELDYLSAFDLTGEPELIKAFAALLIIRDYLTAKEHA